MMRYFFSLVLLGCSVLAGYAAQPTGDRLGKLRIILQTYVRGLDAQIGVAIIAPEGDTLTLNNEERYPLMSVFKFHQALAVGDALKRQQRDLEDTIDIAARELQRETYSPMKEKYAGNDVQLSYAELLTYTLQWSDNIACDILFDRLVPPKQTEVFLKRKTGIGDFQLRHDERGLAKGYQQCYENWTTPWAAATLLQDFLEGKVVDEPYRSFIETQLLHCQTGTEKLPKGLPNSGTPIGHKTGGGPRTAEGRQVANNDLGFVRLPDGRTYIIAVFIKDAMLSQAESDQAIADISEMTYDFFKH